MTFNKYLKCMSIFALLSVSACDFESAEKGNKWELVGESQRVRGESRTAGGGGLGWVMMSMARPKEVALKPLMQAIAEEDSVASEVVAPNKSMMGLRISKHISTEYDGDVDFYSTQPLEKKRTHILDQRPEIQITKDYTNDVPVMKAIEPAPVDEIAKEEIKTEIEEVVEPTPEKRTKVKKADSIFRKFAVSKK